jgi:flagellar export protein FliJ
MARRHFSFSLEPVRAVRENAERVAMRDLAGELEHAARLQRDVDTTMGRLSDARGGGETGPMTALDLAARQLYLERMERELAEARVRAAAQDQHVEASRDRLRHAAQEREQVDRLQQRRRAEHDLETRRLERAENDEISILMHLKAAS